MEKEIILELAQEETGREILQDWLKLWNSFIKIINLRVTE